VAQLRLHPKFRRLLAHKVMKTKVVVAVAREVAGFVWAVGQHVQNTGWKGLPIEASPRACPSLLATRRRTSACATHRPVTVAD
jgi:hypothetical protein